MNYAQVLSMYGYLKPSWITPARMNSCLPTRQAFRRGWNGWKDFMADGIDFAYRQGLADCLLKLRKDCGGQLLPA